MEVRTELDSYQRELLMRMYRSRLNEEVFPVSFDMRGVGEALMRCGLIVAVNGFYEFTEHGLDAWKMYGDKLNLVAKQHELKYRQKKQAEAEKKMAEQKQTELSDWEKVARENLSSKQVGALRMLYEAGADTVWVDADINPVTRNSLVRYGYIEHDSKTNKYWLLDAGVQKLEAEGISRNGGLPKPEELVNAKVRPFVAGLDNADSLLQETPIPQPLPQSIREGEQCADDCEECVYREVVALLSDKYPEVGELAAAMRTKKKVLARLKLGG